MLSYRPTGFGTSTAGGGDPAVLPEHTPGVYSKPVQRIAALRSGLRQNPRRSHRTPHARHAKLQHVHLAQAKE